MTEEALEKPEKSEIAVAGPSSLAPTAEEFAVLKPIERTGFKLVRAMNFGVWKRFSWCLNNFFKVGNASFCIGHRAFFFSPASSRENDIGIFDCFRFAAYLLYHHEFCFFQTFFYYTDIRHAHQGIGSHDPYCF